MQRILIVTFCGWFIAGCSSSWSTSNVDNSPGAKPAAVSAPDSTAPQKLAQDIIVTDEGITNRKYETLGAISVTVNKTTLFHKDPTPALVNEELRKEAAKLGADAVVLVRYGSIGVSAFSWGSLDGKGRAVRFTE